MPHLELLTPWLTFVVILLPLRYLERWIHRHLYGVGWLLTQDRERATVLYYLILLPGVFLHEFTQWLVAGAFKLKLGKVRVWPRPQADGALRLDFVRLSRNTGRAARAVVEITPFIAGIGIVLFISRSVFNVAGLSAALSSGELSIIQTELGRLFATPDFWLWLYLLFAIGNAMLPTPAEEQNWPLKAAAFTGITALLITIAFLGESVQTTLKPILGSALDILATAFSTILVLDIFVVLALLVAEKLLERITGRRVSYRQPRKARPIRPEPGGETPLPASEAPERIADRRLPIPPPPGSEQRAHFLPASVSPALPGHTPAAMSQQPRPDDPRHPKAYRPLAWVTDHDESIASADHWPADSSDMNQEPGEKDSTTGEEDTDNELRYEDLEDIP